MALPIGCSDADSAEPASSRSCARVREGSHGAASTTRSLHEVSVPVLSKTTAVTREAASSTSPPLKRMPRSAPTPVPTITAVGVASPIAHGQAMTSTAQPNMKASDEARCHPCIDRSGSSSSERRAAQLAHVRRASATTAGTKTDEMRSAKACTSGLRICASDTTFMILASTVSLPTAPTRTQSAPEQLSVPPITCAPSALGTGTGSPVTMCSFTSDEPCTTLPSTGS
mmetsp:Transcript_42724/g.134807  ORF Transcript_42724/g.134807 Transcript_42724/m.134807 type:complete len:228 (+) Transcript_42724:999-1682(+)